MCACLPWEQEKGRRLWCVEEEAREWMAPQLRSLSWSEVSVGQQHVCGVAEDDGSLHCFARHLTFFGPPSISSPEDFTTA